MADAVEDKGPLVLGVIITTLTLGGIFISARIITRSIIKPQFGWDDGLIILTWFIILGYNTAMFVSLSHGYGKHSFDLTDQQATLTIHAEVIGQVFAIASFPSGKASVAYLLLRLFPGKRLKWFLTFFVVGNAIFFYIDAILVLTQCRPIAFQWDHSIPGGSCWNPNVVIDWGFLTGVFGALTDFVLAILPWFLISKLKMGLKEKVTVGVALSMGIFASVCSILKIYYTGRLGAHADFTFDTIPLVLWSCAELCAINIAACIPTLRPLYMWFTRNNPHGSTTNHSTTYRSKYGTGSRNFRRHADDSVGNVPLGSLDNHDNNIYQSKSYNVVVKDREDSRSGTESGVGATVAVYTY